ncbi:MAG TPA: RidA family protein, partial [Nocardioidaceae bacterium]|nr:RidA family protein [Nocardioidaceae bacterium]
MSDATPEQRLADMGMPVPEVVPPVAAYVPAVRTGSLVYTAGQVPKVGDGYLYTGKVGAEVTPEQGVECA